VTDILLIIAVVLLIAAVVLLLMLLRKPSQVDVLPSRLDAFKRHRNVPSVQSERKWPRAETNWARQRENNGKNSPKLSRSSANRWYNE